MENSTKNEHSINNRYLIVKENESLNVVTYRNNLVTELEKFGIDISEYDCKKRSDDSANNIAFREIISAADKMGYSVYQLMRL